MNRHTGSLMLRLIFVIGFMLLISGCPKTPRTATQAAPIPEPRTELPPHSPAEQPLPPPPVKEPQPPSPPQAQSLADVYFDFDRADVTPAARTTLEQDAKWLVDHPRGAVQIEGHCDERGTNEYNLALGERRAHVVKRMLIAMGISADRLSTISYGEERPVCREHQESCYRQNRRAHLVVR
ncbi:MAG: peptidoglycan-associated lipoprotein Pal [Nitrospirae bacterium]|nr:peptidoglycan-associated lipoprotein Pal [Nitrospirota bacterium]